MARNKRGVGNKVASFFFIRLLAQYKKVLIETMKLQAATYYLRAVKSARSAAIAAVCVAVCIAFFVVGIIFLHAALILCAGWSPSEIGWFLLICGAVYAVVPAIIVIRLLSSKTWIKMSKADRVVGKALEDTRER